MSKTQKLYDVNVHYEVVLKVKNIKAEDADSAKEIAVGDAVMHLADGKIVHTDAHVVKIEDIEDIMNTTNNHDKALVDAINNAWNEKRDDFENIVGVLMLRDEEEWDEKGVEWDIHSYLMQVADNQDLQCILDYLRIPNNHPL